MDFGITNPESVDFYGLSSYPVVRGAAFMNRDNEFFGFLSSHPHLINFISKNQYEVMLTRSISGQIEDRHMAMLQQVYFFSHDVESYVQ